MKGSWHYLNWGKLGLFDRGVGIVGIDMPNYMYMPF